MKNHQYVNGQLLQTNKTFDMLKQRQKEKIAEWMYSAYKNRMINKKSRPDNEDDSQIVVEVLAKIQEAGIWIPDGEIYDYYTRKKSRLQARLEKEIGSSGTEG